MGIRNKLLDFKRRLSDRKMYSVVIVALAVVAGWGIYQYKTAADLRQELDNQYNRAFYDMLGYVDNVQMLLAKSLISASNTKTASIMQEAWRQANLAQTNLGQLPINPPTLEKTSKYLTQVGDFAYSLNNQNMKGKELSDKQYETLEKLYGYAVSLRDSLEQLQSDLGTGRLKWGELRKKGTSIFQRTSTKITGEQFENIDKTFQEYPTLIYDGPFSDHITNTKPKALTGDTVSVDQARERVIKFFGKDKVQNVTNTSKNDSEPFKTYSYTVTFKDRPEEETAVIDITQKGGHPYYMLYNRAVEKEVLNIDQAKAAGKKFLEEQGFKNMTDTYYLKEDNTATINYAYTQDGIVIYPDLIKVKVALDNGEILGFEAKGYLSSHTDRNIPEPSISEEEARSKISSKIKVYSSGLAIIPTEYKTELFTYEFKGKLNDKDFIVYINANTGEEEDILMIINTPNGVLTM